MDDVHVRAGGIVSPPKEDYLCCYYVLLYHALAQMHRGVVYGNVYEVYRCVRAATLAISLTYKASKQAAYQAMTISSMDYPHPRTQRHKRP